jgi:23S rRNA (guanine745-N1)-methyltransferase
MLADVVDFLICPICHEGLATAGSALRCPRGHSFDVARQGYVSLLTGSRPPGTADSAAQVTARAGFLGAGHYAPLTAAVATRAAAHLAAIRPPAARDTAPDPGRDTAARPTPKVDAAVVPGAGGPPALVLDAGAGPGHYLAAALDQAPAAVGIALDVSKHAVRRAARAHPRIGAVVADVWRPLPVRDASVHVLLNVFAPRNGPEFARVLAPDGGLIVVTPTERHLRPLVDRLGLLTVDAEKERRVEESLAGRFVEVDRETVEFAMTLGGEDIAAVVGMGPNARHVDPDVLRGRMAGTTQRVTASFRVSSFTRTATSRPST